MSFEYWMVAIIVVAIATAILWFVREKLFFRILFSDIKEVDGKCINKKYTSSYTQTMIVSNGNNGTSTTLILHPAKYEVCIDFDNEVRKIDWENLYKNIEIKDKVRIQYQEKYRMRKNQPDTLERKESRLLTVTTPNGQIFRNCDSKEVCGFSLSVRKKFKC